MTKENSLRGKKSRAAGGRFELKVRKDLEDKGWIVDKWSNNVEFEEKRFILSMGADKILNGKLIPAKRRYNPFSKALAIGTGFPDFIAFKEIIGFPNEGDKSILCSDGFNDSMYEGNVIIGVESKSNGYLDKTEKEKCIWLLENNIFSKILIAKKGTKRGEIIYEEFKNVK